MVDVPIRGSLRNLFEKTRYGIAYRNESISEAREVSRVLDQA